MTLAVEEAAPPFALRNQRFEKVSFEDLLGERFVLVFIPFAFTGTCQGELCEIRDNLDVFEGHRVFAVTCNTSHSNAVWAEQQGFTFDLLSDFWPHGEVAKAYGTFDEKYGYAKRTTYFVDEVGIVTDVIASDDLGVARPFDSYLTVLGRT